MTHNYRRTWWMYGSYGPAWYLGRLCNNRCHLYHSSSSSPVVRSSTFPSHSMPVNYPLASRSMNHTFRTMTSNSFSLINSKKPSQHIAFEHIFLSSGPQWKSWRNLSDRRSSSQFIYPSTAICYVSYIRHKPQDLLDVALGTRSQTERQFTLCGYWRPT